MSVKSTLSLCEKRTRRRGQVKKATNAKVAKAKVAKKANGRKRGAR